MIYVFLAQGFEEVEALAPVDILKRGGVEVVTVGVGNKYIRGSHGITVAADMEDKEFFTGDDIQGVVLPGGMPGTINLEANRKVIDAVKFCNNNGLLVGAICAAPSILGHLGLLEGKKATAFPGFETELKGAVCEGGFVETDGNIITAKGMGVAVEFGLALLAYIKGKDMAEKVKATIQCAN